MCTPSNTFVNIYICIHIIYVCIAADRKRLHQKPVMLLPVAVAAQVKSRRASQLVAITIMTANVPQLVAMINSVSTVLRTMAGSNAVQRRDVSKQQALAVTAFIRQSSLTLAELAPVATSTEESHFGDDDKQSIIDAIASQSVQEAGGSKFQNWESVFDMLPTSVLAKVGTAAFAPAVLAWCLAGGLTKPTEGTYRVLAMHFILDTEGFTTCSQMETTTRHEAINMVKKWFRSIVPSDAVNLGFDLPKTAFEFEREQPVIYQRLYSLGDLPQKSPFNAVHISFLVNNTSCRQPKNLMQMMMPRGKKRCAMLQDDRRQLPAIQDDVRHDRMMQGLSLARPPARQDTVDRALAVGGVQPGLRAIAGPGEVASPAAAPAPAAALAPAPDAAPGPVPAESPVMPASPAAAPAPAHAIVPAESPVMPVASNLKEVTAVIWQAMEDKKAKAKLLAAETRKAKGEGLKASKAAAENSDDMTLAIVATPPAKVTKLKK